MISKRGKMGELNVACISDIHIGHPKVTSVSILDGLYKAFPNNKETADLDIIFIAGDFFDRNLHLSHEHVGEIQLFISYLIRLCEQHNIVLRNLEGTPSHDWKQGCLFMQIHALLDSKADVRWIENLSIEYIESLDVNVLYVPDEWEHDPNETWKQVKGLLNDHGLDKVDFSIMHGMFEFQIPQHINISHHMSERYLGITNHYISIGHHHTQRSFKRVLVQGSFDRLCHGEEGAKGHYRIHVNVNGSGKDELTFVENDLATKFVTINCLDLTLSDTLDLLKERIDHLPTGSHIRVIARAGSEVSSAKRELEEMWERFRWTVNREAVEETSATERITITERYQAANIDKETVTRLLKQRYFGDMEDSKREKMFALLDEVL